MVVEALLVEVINIKLNDEEFDAFELSFPKKVDLCVSLGLLNRTKKPAYLKLNSLRNRFAHRLGYQFTLKDAVDYANELNEMGFCFSDNNILEKDLSKQYYDIDIILIEILNWLTIELQSTLFDHGKAVEE